MPAVSRPAWMLTLSRFADRGGAPRRSPVEIVATMGSYLTRTQAAEVSGLRAGPFRPPPPPPARDADCPPPPPPPAQAAPPTGPPPPPPPPPPPRPPAPPRHTPPHLRPMRRCEFNPCCYDSTD